MAEHEARLPEDLEATDPYPEPPKSAPHRRRLRRWMLIGVAVVAAILLVLPGVSTIQAGYYRRYPGLGDRMDHWSTSTHARITCIECHVEPGVKGRLDYGVRSVPAFYSQLLNGADNTNLFSPPSRAACQECHTSYRAVSPSGDLLIPHRAHVEVLKLECVECHKDLVHSDNRRGFNRPEMELCLEKCHDGDKAANECVNCHTRKQTPKSHEAKTWLQVHGRLSEEQDCGQCHDWTPEYCKECHAKRPASHAGNWKKKHASVAKVSESGCIVCHGKKYCEKCH